MVQFGSVCSGIESASLAWEPLGMSAAWFAEVEKFPSQVLAHHWPNVPNMGDMCALPEMITGGLLQAPKVLVGGTPCQAFSVAGARKGLDDPRGQLTIKYVEVANAIDGQRDADDGCVTVWENVHGVLSDRDNAFGCFLGELVGEDFALEPGPRPALGKSSGVWRWDKKQAKHVARWSNAGCVFGPKRTAAWRVLDAQYFGVAQRRRRVFVVASSDTRIDPAKILFESEGVRRDTPPSREAGQAVACTLAAHTGAGGFPGTDESIEGCVVPFRPAGFGGFTEGVGTLMVKAGGSVGLGGSETILAFDMRQSDVAFYGDKSGTLDTQTNTIGVLYDFLVRRLMPVECERLQGMPDGHTLIPGAADGPRYKAVGNSKAVPVVQWLGRRLLENLPC